MKPQSAQGRPRTLLALSVRLRAVRTHPGATRRRALLGEMSFSHLPVLSHEAIIEMSSSTPRRRGRHRLPQSASDPAERESAHAKAMRAEQVANHRLIQAQRELRREISRREAAKRFDERKAAVLALRDDMDARVGLDFVRELSVVLPADDLVLREVAERLNERIQVEVGEPTRAAAMRRWQKLFQEADTDCSGRISYDEFLVMMKKITRGKRRRRPTWPVLNVWRAIDTNGDGFISVGEFYSFMRRGLEGTEEARRLRDRIERRRSEEREAGTLKSASDGVEAAVVAPATTWQVRELSQRLNERVATHAGGTWFKLYASMSADARESGRITWADFATGTRKVAGEPPNT